MKSHHIFHSSFQPVQRVVQASLTGMSLALAACSIFPGSLSVAGIVYAQNTNATIRGQVLDPSGALVPNASIRIVNQDTGVVVFDGQSDSAGTFVAPQVIPGPYRVNVGAPGLKQSVTENLIATVAQVTSININLELGQTTETVTVQSKGEELDRSTSDITTLISPAEVQNIPLQGRAVENLLAFIPGVAHGGAGDTPNTSQLSINGSRTLNTEVLLNGVSTIIASTGSPLSLPSSDGVDSFRVITTNAPAEYGRTSGAVISVNTISGTNTYHGNLYFLLKNEALDANTYFHKETINATTGAVTPRSRDRFFQAGGSFGGPIRIPHLYNGRDKTFFFVNFDRTIQPSSTLVSATVPTAAQRTGDLSNAVAATDANGNKRTPQTIYQPNGLTSLPFANGRVTGIDPAAAKILALLPLPNTVGTYDPVNNRYTGNWTSLQNLTQHTNKIVVRVDEVATPQGSSQLQRLPLHDPATPADHLQQPAAEHHVGLHLQQRLAPLGRLHPHLHAYPGHGPEHGLFPQRRPAQPARRRPGRVPALLGIASLAARPDAGADRSRASRNVGADTNTNQVNITNTFTPFGTVTKTLGPHTFRVRRLAAQERVQLLTTPRAARRAPVRLRRLHHQPRRRRQRQHRHRGLPARQGIKTAQAMSSPSRRPGAATSTTASSLQDDWRATTRPSPSTSACGMSSSRP